LCSSAFRGTGSAVRPTSSLHQYDYELTHAQSVQFLLGSAASCWSHEILGGTCRARNRTIEKRRIERLALRDSSFVLDPSCTFYEVWNVLIIDIVDSDLILSLELARRVHDEIAGGKALSFRCLAIRKPSKLSSSSLTNSALTAWTRDVPFDFARTSSILDSLESRRRVGTTFVQYIDKYIDTIQPPVPLQHFPSNLGNDPTERIKSSEITAMRSYRIVIQIGWTYLTLLVYQELRKRQRNWKASDQTNERYVKSKLDFCVGHEVYVHGQEVC